MVLKTGFIPGPHQVVLRGKQASQKQQAVAAERMRKAGEGLVNIALRKIKKHLLNVENARHFAQYGASRYIDIMRTDGVLLGIRAKLGSALANEARGAFYPDTEHFKRLVNPLTEVLSEMGYDVNFAVHNRTKTYGDYDNWEDGGGSFDGITIRKHVLMAQLTIKDRAAERSP